MDEQGQRIEKQDKQDLLDSSGNMLQAITILRGELDTYSDFMDTMELDQIIERLEILQVGFNNRILSL